MRTKIANLKKDKGAMVSVIVVTRNEEKTISQCLDSLIALDFPKDKYEVIVVDGASFDSTREICKRYSVKLMCLDRASISYQRNAGVKAAQGKYVAFTDADCVTEKAWLRKLVDQMGKSDESVVAVGGPNLVFDDDPPLSKVIGYAQQTFLGSGGSPQSHRISKTTYVNSIPNCNILYKREIIAKEKYDESFSVGDDGEFNFRLKQRGYKFLYSPDTVVWHHRPNTLGSFVKKMFLYGEALARITKKHKRIVRWYALPVTLAVLAVILSYPVIRFFHPATYIYASLISLYIVALAIVTAQVYKNYKNISSLLAMILLPLQHFFYALGFLKGLFDVRRVK